MLPMPYYMDMEGDSAQPVDTQGDDQMITLPTSASELWKIVAEPTAKWYERDGKECTRKVHVINATTASYSYQDSCDRCGGAGGWQGWPGFTCYGCGGNGKGKIRTVKVYTAEKLAKLVAADEKRQAKKVSAAQAEEAARQTVADAFLAANDGLREALATKHDICRDLSAKLLRFGSLSPAQIALAHKLAAQAVAPKPIQIMPPTGRVEITGKVIKVKETEGFRGADAWKMIVAVEGQGGEFRLYGSVPASLLEDDGALRGRRVAFTATVQPKEPGFGFFSRPTQARLLEVAS